MTSKPGSFLPLLDYSQRRESQGRDASSPVNPPSLLEILGRQTQQSLPLLDLQTLGNMDPARYGAALKSLRDTGFIEIAGDVPEQIVKLTANGENVARVARSA